MIFTKHFKQTLKQSVNMSDTPNRLIILSALEIVFVLVLLEENRVI